MTPTIAILSRIQTLILMKHRRMNIHPPPVKTSTPLSMLLYPIPINEEPCFVEQNTQFKKDIWK